MRSNVLLHCVCVLAWTASVPTEAREIGTLQARQEYKSILATPILARPTSPLVETVTTVVCTATHPKAQILSFLNNCNEILATKLAVFKGLCDTTDASNAQAVGAQVASDLETVLALLNLGVAQIQKCGIDPSPLKLDLGVSISDVSHAAFEVVMSLKPVFETVTDLMTKFSVLHDSCESILLRVSTALANLVGACSEQVNLFDVGFFKLAKPQMKIFSEIGSNFDAFSGTFI